MANEQEDYQGKLILKPMKLKIVQTSETKKFARLEAFTLFEIIIFCPKIQLLFPKKIVNFFGVKNS